MTPSTASRTAAIREALGSLRRRIRGRFLLHGAGILAAALAGTGLAHYALDRLLDLPSAVRLLLSAGLLAGTLVAARRFVLYPLRRSFGLTDVALAVERRFPDLKERLITAVQLGHMEPSRLREQSPELVALTVEEAAAQIRALPLRAVLDPRGTLRLWGLAGALCLALGVTLAARPEAAAVWMARLAGAGTPYPRLTHLTVELPEDGPELRVRRDGASARVELARGADFRVVVRADGRVPWEVFLVASGRGAPQRRVSMVARGDGTFGHVFRRVAEGFTFHAAGGDDPRGDLLVEVATVVPPEVAGVTATVAPPAYTGMAPTVQRGGPVEALEGSQVSLRVETTLPVAHAELVLEEAGTRLPLTVVGPGGEGPEGDRQDGDGPRGAILEGLLAAERSDRYSVELHGADGLRNVRPGTYPLVVTRDRPPALRLLLPRPGEDTHILAGAVVPVRLLAEDDYGLSDLVMTHQLGTRGGQERRVLHGTPPAEEGVPSEGATEAPRGPQRSLFHTSLHPVGELGGGETVAEGDTITLQFTARDNRAPDPQESRPLPVLINVVGEGELSRRLAGHFRRVREDVERLLGQQEERKDRLSQILSVVADNVELAPADRLSIHAEDAAQSRILTGIRRVREDVMASFDSHLFNRLDDSLHLPRILERYVAFHRAHPQPRSHAPGFYEALAEARRTGEIGQLEMLDRLLAMFMASHRSLETHGQEAVRALVTASTITGSVETRAALGRALEMQEQIAGELRSLLEMLDEWNDYQDVIQLARQILQRQKEIQGRTRGMLRGR